MGNIISSIPRDRAEAATFYANHRWACIGGAIALSLMLPGRKYEHDQEIDCADFDGFLKKRPEADKDDRYAGCVSSDFSSFIGGSNTAHLAANAASAKATVAAPASAPTLSASSKSSGLVILYGTEYGFSREIAEKLTKLVQSQGYSPRLIDMADVPDGLNLASEKCVVMACSTQGDGVPPNEAREFVEWLDDKCTPLSQDVAYSVLALGDKSYQHYCACGKRLDARMEKLGAKRLVERVDVDKEDWSAVEAWMAAIMAALPSTGIEAGAIVTTNGAATATATAAVTTNGVAKKKFSRTNPYLATVSSIQSLSVVDNPDDKDTVLVEFDLGDSGIQYTPGDALGVVPRNEPTSVRSLLAEWGKDGREEVAPPSWKQQLHGGVAAAGSIPLELALMTCFDLRDVKPELLRVLKTGYEAMTDGSKSVEYAKLVELTGGEDGASLLDTKENNKKKKDAEAIKAAAAAAAKARESYLAARHAIDILKEFPLYRPTTTEFLSSLRPLQARLYSISSSQREHPNRVQISVAVVRYFSLSVQRIGVCSTFVSERLEVGNQVPIFLHKNPDFRLPADASKPIIMVGPGTGLAPFRSFMQDRILAGTPYGTSLLFFGCRRRDQDFLYGSLLENWDKENKMKLVTAFSREGKDKVYVQHRLKQQGDLVWELLEQGGHFYVCGDASSMAGAVEETLLEILGGKVGGKDKAVEYLDAMRKEERYQRDVWY